MAKNPADAIPAEYFDAARKYGLKIIYLIEGHFEPVFEPLFAKLKQAAGANVIEVPVPPVK